MICMTVKIMLLIRQENIHYELISTEIYKNKENLQR